MKPWIHGGRLKSRVVGIKETDKRKAKSALPVTKKHGAAAPLKLEVNAHPFELQRGNRPDQVDPGHTLAYTLRETLGLTGTKISCDHGACGACTVLIDGKAMLACMILTIECDGKKITTIEGLVNPKTGSLDPLQQAFIDHAAFQCGFCTPGMIMSAKALLEVNPSPTEADVNEALSGHFCRCISHYHVTEAVMAASPNRKSNDGK
jgi:carbon-monoxide dehydrogenase small subunit